MKISKNKRAEKLMGLRKKGQPIDYPIELGYRCPICKKTGEEKMLEFSEYNAFMYCPSCNIDIPSCCCVGNTNIIKWKDGKEIVQRMSEVFLDSIEQRDKVKHV